VAIENDPAGQSVRDALRRAEQARAEAERRASSAIALFAAVARLHDASGRADVIAAIREIAQGCLGSEKVAIFLLDAGSGRHVGVAAGPEGPAALEAEESVVELVARTASLGRVTVGAQRGPGKRDVAVPMGLSGTPGVLVVYAMAVEGGQPSSELRQRLEIVAHHLGIALAQAGR
jgi:hypothetical protein